MNQKNICHLCGGSNTEIRFSQLKSPWKAEGRFDLWRCLDCGVGFIDPQPNFQTLEADLYDEEYHAYQPQKVKKRKAKDFVKKAALNQFLGYGSKKWWQNIFFSPFLRMSFYPQARKQGKILEIGCGAGKYLHYLKALNWDVYGVDISKQAVKVARDSGLENITQGTLFEAKYPDNFFDVVNLHHVLEHLPKAKDILKEAHRIIKPGGEIVVTLPNFSSLAAWMFRKKWGGMDVPRHVFHFNKKSLTKVLEGSGFNVDKVWYSDTFRGLAAGLSYLFFRDGRKHEKYFLPPAIGLDLLFDPLFLKFGWGDQITIKAKKK